MSDNLSQNQDDHKKIQGLGGASIRVFGSGGAGCNAVNRMIEAGLGGIEFWVANTDGQALEVAQTCNRIQLGERLTRGLGAGGNPEVGKQAAEESIEDIAKALDGADMIFITVGMGGGTGTGSASKIAEVAKEKGILTIGVVTKPFSFEGRRRKKIAEEGIERLKEQVDALIIIPNDKLLEVTERQTSMNDAFALADEVLLQGVQGISDIINVPGLINVDFADVKSVMKAAGSAIMGMGRAAGEGRAVAAAKQAISSPLLENTIKGATGIIFNVTGGADLTLHEVNEAAESIYDSVAEEANIIIGAVIDEKLQGEIQITVIATGFEMADKNHQRDMASAKEKASPFSLNFASSFGSSREKETKTTASPNRLFFDSASKLNKSEIRSSVTSPEARDEMRVRPMEEKLLDIPDFLKIKN